MDVYVYPTPAGGVRFRPQVVKRGGKAQFPYIIDPNTGYEGYESDAIVRYLFETYGAGSIPIPLALGTLTNISSGFSTVFRPGKGRRRFEKTIFPSKPLELWAYEPSPFSRVVREKLAELELPYLLHPTARGSINRAKQMERTGGAFQAPYLEDINTGAKLFESPEIVKYLMDVYGPDAEGASSSLPSVLVEQVPVLGVPEFGASTSTTESKV